MSGFGGDGSSLSHDRSPYQGWESGPHREPNLATGVATDLIPSERQICPRKHGRISGPTIVVTPAIVKPDHIERSIAVSQLETCQNRGVGIPINSDTPAKLIERPRGQPACLRSVIYSRPDVGKNVQRHLKKRGAPPQTKEPINRSFVATKTTLLLYNRFQSVEVLLKYLTAMAGSSRARVRSGVTVAATQERRSGGVCMWFAFHREVRRCADASLGSRVVEIAAT